MAAPPPPLQHLVASADELVGPQFLGGKGLKGMWFCGRGDKALDVGC
jgi:hypothetical protein